MQLNSLAGQELPDSILSHKFASPKIPPVYPRRMRTILLLSFALCRASLCFGAPQTEFIVLVTGDGIRHQEIFGGADPALMDEANKKSSGIESLPALRDKFWAETPEARREKLMPFFWTELAARHGVVFGNQALGSKVVVSNFHHFSYPGYAEILNGQPLAKIDSNDRVWSPRQTLLEFLAEKQKLPAAQVAAFASWDVFNWICMTRDAAVFCNAGYEAMPASFSSENHRLWSALQFQMLSPWDTVRHDAVTLNLALEYLQTEKPRFLYLALGETDDWAHDRRYDRTLQAARLFDDSLRQLWTLLQNLEPYRGRTTLLVATDHGRGRSLQDWTDHNNKIPGADEVWIGVFGAAVSQRGELRDTGTLSNSQIAATLLQFLGLDPQHFNPQAAPPIPAKHFELRR